MVLSTAISDGVLAVASLGGAGWIARRLPGAPARWMSLLAIALGLTLMGAAALVGSLRFAGCDALTGLHALLTALARFGAMPLIGLGHAALAWRVGPRALLWVATLVVLAVLPALASLLDQGALYGLVIGTVGVLGVLAAAAERRAREPVAAASAAAGGVLVLLAGLVIGTRGAIGPVLRVDAFHYAMALAAGLLARAADHD